MDCYKTKAYAKVNLGLDVLEKRADGYHDIKTVMQEIDLYDNITVFPIDSGVSMECNIPSLSTGEDNLCIKAVRIIEKYHGLSYGYHIKLEKNIPMEAGLAGGSTDAAAVLKAIVKLEGLDISKETLLEYAAKLGADVPFCVVGGCAVCEGIGEILTPIKTDFNLPILLIKPSFGISTGMAYGMIDNDKGGISPDIDGIVSALVSGEIDLLTNLLRGANVFENAAIRLHPSIKDMISEMEHMGALCACMSGSGPTLFGIFNSISEAKCCEDKMKELFDMQMSVIAATKTGDRR